MDLYNSYLKRFQTLQRNVAEFFDDLGDVEEKFQSLVLFFEDTKIESDKEELKEFLYLISSISQDHNRMISFHSKIEKIIDYLSDSIKRNFTNLDIFKIFQNSKRVLLYLIENKLLFIDNELFMIITKEKFKRLDYHKYFYPEIRDFYDSEIEDAPKVTEEFKEKRKIGENDNYICELIRTDSIGDFISHVNQKSINLSSSIIKSIFETNFLLLCCRPSLIEYSAFFGSIQIFKYLFMNGAKVSGKIWKFAAHSNNPELIAFLEESNIKTDDNYLEFLIESIKANHIDFVNYIKNNLYIKSNLKNDNLILSASIKTRYFECYPQPGDKYLFYNLCKYDNLKLADILLKNFKVNINSKIVLKIFSLKI